MTSHDPTPDTQTTRSAESASNRPVSDSQRSFERRTFLASSVSVVLAHSAVKRVAGASDAPRAVSDETVTDADDRRHAGDEPPAPRRRLSIRRVDPVPDPAISLRVDLPRPVLTPSATATVRLALTATDAPVDVAAPRPGPFPPSHSEPTPAWVLLPSADAPRPPADGLWRLPETDHAASERFDSLLTHRVAPGDPLTGRFELWSDRRADAPLPTGVFRFESGFTVAPESRVDAAPDRTESGDRRDPVAFDWGFTLAVTAPDDPA